MNRMFEASSNRALKQSKSHITGYAHLTSTILEMCKTVLSSCVWNIYIAQAFVPAARRRAYRSTFVIHLATYREVIVVSKKGSAWAIDSEVVYFKVREAGPIPNNNIHPHVHVRQMLCRGVREKYEEEEQVETCR